MSSALTPNMIQSKHVYFVIGIIVVIGIIYYWPEIVIRITHILSIVSNAQDALVGSCKNLENTWVDYC